jgi:hypothetical protein
MQINSILRNNLIQHWIWYPQVLHPTLDTCLMLITMDTHQQVPITYALQMTRFKQRNTPSHSSIVYTTGKYKIEFTWTTWRFCVQTLVFLVNATMIALFACWRLNEGAMPTTTDHGQRDWLSPTMVWSSTTYWILLISAYRNWVRFSH